MTRRGFTLIELLVCIAIIALMIGLASVGLSGSRDAARRQACHANLRTLWQATNVYLVHATHLPVMDEHPADWTVIVEVVPVCPLDRRDAPMSYAYVAGAFMAHYGTAPRADPALAREVTLLYERQTGIPLWEDDEPRHDGEILTVQYDGGMGKRTVTRGPP